MTRLLSLTLAVIFITSLCVAAQGAKSGNQAVFMIGKTYSFAGTVDSMKVSGADKAIDSLMDVVDETGVTMTFRIKIGTPVYEKTGMSTTLDKITEGTKVRVDFRTNELGVNKAKTVRVIE